MRYSGVSYKDLSKIRRLKTFFNQIVNIDHTLKRSKTPSQVVRQSSIRQQQANQNNFNQLVQGGKFITSKILVDNEQKHSRSNTDK